MKKVINVYGVNVPIGSHEGKTIVIGSDHRGFEYKEDIKRILKGKKYSIIDVGAFSRERCDYPSVSDAMGRLVGGDLEYNRVGIGICGSGIGILIPASKCKGVYVSRCLNSQEAGTSRKHNNTNVLGIGADCVNLEEATKIIDMWLRTPFYSMPSKEENYMRRYVQTVKLENALQSN